MLQPIILPANQPPRFYRGGELIADFRGTESRGVHFPEDWVASTTTLVGEPEQGLTVLPDGRRLIDAIDADPVGWLGAEHVATFGTDTKLLVKLLNTAQRLPIHAHPSREFAGQRLGRPHGKAEAWHILAGGEVYLGLNRTVEVDELSAIVTTQDTERLLSLMHRRVVGPGQTVFVPPGTLHAIGPDILLAEVQEPEDLSIVVDWRGFDVDLAPVGHLGLGYETALLGVDRTGRTAEEIDALIADPGDGDLLPSNAGQYFRADRLRAGAEVGQGYAVLIVVAGVVDLTSATASFAGLPSGTTLVLPYALDRFAVSGAGEVLVYRPPVAAERDTTTSVQEPARG